MAKTTKTTKPTAEDEAEEVIIPGRRNAPSGNDDEDAGITPTAETQGSGEKPTRPEVSDDDMVNVTVFENVDPAPVVGLYLFRDHGVTKLEKHKIYRMPKDVAAHLVDRRVGAIIAGA